MALTRWLFGNGSNRPEEDYGARRRALLSVVRQLQNKQDFAGSIPPLKELSDLLAEHFRADLEARASTLDAIGIAHRMIGELQQAETWYRRALEIRENDLNLTQSARAKSLNNLGMLKLFQGDLEAASEYLNEAVAIRERYAGLDDQHTQASLTALIEVLARLRRYEEAIESVRKLIARENPEPFGPISAATVRIAEKSWSDHDLEAAAGYYALAAWVIYRHQPRIEPFGDHPLISGSLAEHFSGMVDSVKVVDQPEFFEAMLERVIATAAAAGAPPYEVKRLHACLGEVRAARSLRGVDLSALRSTSG
jgi:tetratricopeptide (TPR) repeat protein